MAKTSLSRAPDSSGAVHHAGLGWPGVAVAALMSVLVPALRAGPAGASVARRGAARRLAPVSRGQCGRHGGRLPVCECGGAAELPGSGTPPSTASNSPKNLTSTRPPYDRRPGQHLSSLAAALRSGLSATAVPPQALGALCFQHQEHRGMEEQ